MEATSPLRDDHALLRKKLVLLESALQVAPEKRGVLRDLCVSLQRFLQDHIHREAHLLQVYYHRIPSGRYISEAGDHSAEQRLLRAVNELLASGIKASVPMVVLRLSHAIEQLQEQMDRQERTVFPSLDYTQEARMGSTETISSSMSVNEILLRYPQTESVFERLRINRLRDGYESVDELAWRQGIDVSQLVEELLQVVTFPGF